MTERISMGKDPVPDVVTPIGRYGTVLATSATLASAHITGTAKLVCYYPISLPFSGLLVGYGLGLGSAPVGNVQMGLYKDGTLIHSTGTVDVSAATGSQIAIDTTNFQVFPGDYYLAHTFDTAGANSQWGPMVWSASLTRRLGYLEEVTGSFGLPTTWTPVVPVTSNNKSVPIMYFNQMPA